MYSNFKVLNQSHEAIQILKLFQIAGFKSAIIAGGAIRDIYHSTEISDYDIFLQHPGAVISEDLLIQTLGQFYKQTNDELYSATDDGSNGYMPSSKSKKKSRIVEVWNLNRYNLTASYYDSYNCYQFIFLAHDPVEYVKKHFDIGLCKAYCDGVKIHLSEDFMEDSNNQTLTICAKEMSRSEFDYVLDHHLPKLTDKFPGWKVVVAQQNLCHVDENNKYLL